MDLLAHLAADGLLDAEEAAGASTGQGGSQDGEDGRRRSVVLVGVTGDGKSSTGNTLCGSGAFSVSCGFKSETQECAHSDYMRVARDRVSLWRVIDTVGLHDTDLSQKKVLDRFSLFADRTSDGIDAFLFVVRWGRFKPEHDAALDAFVANCGEVALRHTLLVFTHCKESHDEVMRAIAEGAPATLRAWLPRMQGAVGIENELLPARARDTLHEALERLLAANEGLRYSNEALQEARRQQARVEEAERAAFQAAVAEWRRGTGPLVIEREEGVVTRSSRHGCGNQNGVAIGARATRPDS